MINGSLDINSNHLQLIKNILRKYLLTHTTVWVFGSRAIGRARRFSDLDLLLDRQGCPLPRLLLLRLSEAFDASSLPYKVDLVDWNTLSDSFKRHIQNHRVQLDLQ